MAKKENRYKAMSQQRIQEIDNLAYNTSVIKNEVAEDNLSNKKEADTEVKPIIENKEEFTKVNPADEVEEITKVKSTESKDKKKDKIKNTKTKGSVGRPKNEEPSTRKGLYIPDKYIDYITVMTTLKKKTSVSSYITSLIEKDMKENKDIYEQLKKLREE